MEKPDINSIEHQYAGVFLVSNDKIIGQRRDDKPTIDNPNKIGTFGGVLELGETPEQAARRELIEETNLRPDETSIIALTEDVAWRKLTNEWEGRHFYYLNISDRDLDNLEVYEGQGWAEIKGADDADLIELWRPIVRLLLSRLRE